MLNCFMPLIMGIIHQRDNIVSSVLIPFQMMCLVHWFLTHYERLSYIWKLKDIALISIIPGVSTCYDEYGKFNAMDKMKYTMKQVDICDSLDDFLPDELANMVLGYLTTACDNDT